MEVVTGIYIGAALIPIGCWAVGWGGQVVLRKFGLAILCTSK